MPSFINREARFLFITRYRLAGKWYFLDLEISLLPIFHHFHHFDYIWLTFSLFYQTKLCKSLPPLRSCFIQWNLPHMRIILLVLMILLWVQHVQKLNLLRDYLLGTRLQLQHSYKEKQEETLLILIHCLVCTAESSPISWLLLPEPTSQCCNYG